MMEFSADEQRRIQRTLRRRLRNVDPHNLIDVAIGLALRGAKPDEARSPAVCVYVRCKERSITPERRIPEEVEVRWYRDRQLQTAILRTDVIEIPDLAATGFYEQFGRSQFVVSAGIAWRPRRRRRIETAWLTVGHPFLLDHRRRPTRLASGRELIARARAHSQFDAAVVREEMSGQGKGGVVIGDTWEPLPVASLSEVARFFGEVAQSHLPSGAIDIRLQAFLPRFHVPGVGQLVNIVAAIGPPSAFAPGTSGSVWLAAGIPTAMQVAARAPDFALGFGQALSSSLVWAERALEHATFPAQRVGRVRLISL